jgi:cytochrome P450
MHLALQRWLIAAGKLPVPTDDSTTNNSRPFVHDAKALFLFGAGPRVCPGQQLALVMVKVRYTRTTASHRLALLGFTASVDSASG